MGRPVAHGGEQALAAVGRVAGLLAGGLGGGEAVARALGEVRRVVPFACAQVSVHDPLTGAHATVANDGYTAELVAHFEGPAFQRELLRFGMRAAARPMRMRDVRAAGLTVPSIDGVLRPAGFAEGLTMGLVTPGGRYVGMLNLSTLDERHPSDEARAVLAHLGPVLAALADPFGPARRLAAVAAPPGTPAAVLRDGRLVALPGRPGHPLLADPASPLAAQVAAAPPGHRRFVVHDAAGRAHAVRVLAAAEPVVVLDPDPDVHGLTARELHVLALLATGRTNREVAAELVISPRTVGGHVEAILRKLGTPTRAGAVARAVAEGLVEPVI